MFRNIFQVLFFFSLFSSALSSAWCICRRNITAVPMLLNHDEAKFSQPSVWCYLWILVLPLQGQGRVTTKSTMILKKKSKTWWVLYDSVRLCIYDSTAYPIINRKDTKHTKWCFHHLKKVSFSNQSNFVNFITLSHLCLVSLVCKKSAIYDDVRNFLKEPIWLFHSFVGTTNVVRSKIVVCLIVSILIS